MRYLKDKEYYTNLYDLQTIKRCLRFYWDMHDSFEEKRNSKEFKKWTKENFDKEVHKVISLSTNVIAGECYRRKDQTIKEWLDRDQQKQEIYDSATAPVGLICLHCNSSRIKVVSKDMFDKLDGATSMVFMFACSICKKRQAHYENGTPWKYDKPKCPECNSPLESKTTHTKDKLTTYDKCPHCSYENKDVYDFKKASKDRKTRESRDKYLLENYRKMFCWSDKDGQAYIANVEGLKRFNEERSSEEKKAADPKYQMARKLKKLTIVELKKILTLKLKSEKYIELKLSEPDIDKFVIVPFVVQDSDPERNKRASEHDLAKLMRKILKETNWRLMSDGVSYRMGYLSGRLKGYEREEDLVKIV